jgi:hypothetical protein
VAGGDIGARSQMVAIEGLACGNWLEGDHNVVRASEFESAVAQTILLSPNASSTKFTFFPFEKLLVRPHSTPRA